MHTTSQEALYQRKLLDDYCWVLTLRHWARDLSRSSEYSTFLKGRKKAHDILTIILDLQ